ncbi:hypothetical protein OGW06_18590 [Citrobacter sp. Cf128]|uniref:hypothetical protein n=1 Tax=Citrobacter sp. Cf128 TaxID=2985076 RepID=UPI0025762E08|nr:hypothetical protein [Citrobacter sp. Cf128]MDM3114223.1 hypothetical protein [Citrobacter sp. Cf128]
MNVYEMEGFLRGNGIPGDLKVNESNAQYLVRKFSELQSQNADLAVQLANAESKCRELAAEVQAVRWACGQVYMKGYNHGHLNTVDGLKYASDTELVERGGETLADFTDPDHCGVAADAILAEVRAQGVEGFLTFCGEENSVFVEAKAYYRSLSDAVDEFAAQLRQGAKS